MKYYEHEGKLRELEDMAESMMANGCTVRDLIKEIGFNNLHIERPFTDAEWDGYEEEHFPEDVLDSVILNHFYEEDGDGYRIVNIAI